MRVSPSTFFAAFSMPMASAKTFFRTKIGDFALSARAIASLGRLSISIDVFSDERCIFA